MTTLRRNWRPVRGPTGEDDQVTRTVDIDRWARLPKWAQDHIRGLEGEVESLSKTASDGPADSDTFVGSFAIGPDKPLHRGARVKFCPDGPDSLDYYEVRLLRDGALDVRCSVGQLSIMPAAGNSVRIGGIARG